MGGVLLGGPVVVVVVGVGGLNEDVIKSSAAFLVPADHPTG